MQGFSHCSGGGGSRRQQQRPKRSARMPLRLHHLACLGVLRLCRRRWARGPSCRCCGAGAPARKGGSHRLMLLLVHSASRLNDLVKRTVSSRWCACCAALGRSTAV